MSESETPAAGTVADNPVAPGDVVSAATSPASQDQTPAAGEATPEGAVTEPATAAEATAETLGATSGETTGATDTVPPVAPAPLSNLQAILHKVEESFHDCEAIQQEAIALRRQSRALQALLPSLTDAAEIAETQDRRDSLMRQATSREERLPYLLAGVAELMLQQIKEASEQD